MRIETIAAHAGRRIDAATGAVTPPIHMATTFERDADGSYPRGFIYGRSGNPNRAMLEECLAKLEGGAECAAFASGMAALTAVCQSLAPGDHVVAPSDIYHGTARMLREIMAPWGLKTSFVDMTDVERVRKAMTPKTRLVLVETPSNPLLKVVDIKGCFEVAHEAGAVCVVDNTWATPVLQRPLELRADLSVHSSTKYLGGHGDVTGGAVVARESEGIFKKVRHIQQNGGAVPSPFDCWLIMRGIRTLPYRMRAHCENASRVAAFLASHSMVKAAHYPGLSGHPGHRLAKAQMNGFGGMLSFQMKGGREAAFRVASRTRLFTRATSLGSYESLIEHRASIEGPESRTPEDLLRVSVGLEHWEDLVEDLGRAMEG